MIRDEIENALRRVTGKKRIRLQTPEYGVHGDYSSNIAMELASENKDSGVGVNEVVEDIVGKLLREKELVKYVSDIEVAGPGFINFRIKEEVLIDELSEIARKGSEYGSSKVLEGKKYLLEHTSPNTIKTLHIGHVRNNVLGMAVHNLLENVGAKVVLDAVNNDRGIHVMKGVWAYEKFGKGKTPESENKKPDHFVDEYYLKGANMYEKDDSVKKEVRKLLREWESGDKDVRRTWKKLRDWTFEGFRVTYRKLGSRHDWQWFESDFYHHGKDMVKAGLEKKVFRQLDDKAVLTDLKKYKLPDTIVLRSDGTTMYHTQDLYLTKLKKEKFPSDLYIWDVGPEQELYLKQLFAICEQLGIGERQKFMHLSYGSVSLKGKGKVSSRAGNIVSADELIEKACTKAKKIMVETQKKLKLSERQKNDISRMVGLGALKYGFLKVGRTTDIPFDINESLSLRGDSGPYIQYTFARASSVLSKSKIKDKKITAGHKGDISAEELILLRAFIKFPEICVDSALLYAPNLLCEYLYDLAQRYNSFYNKHKVLTEDENVKEFRLSLTYAAFLILKKGLELIGIDTPEKM